MLYPLARVIVVLRVTPTHSLSLFPHPLPHPSLHTQSHYILRIPVTNKPAFPVSYSSLSILLLRFSRDSLVKSKKRKNGFASTSKSRSSASVSPHPELYTVTVNTCHTTTDDDDDNNATPQSRSGETKSAEPRALGRRGGIANLAAEYSINSITAVSNIVNMILAPMVIVPFFDYLEHGKIPRSNTSKPGSADGPTAKMGSLNSISQPIAKGWTVIFVSVR